MRVNARHLYQRGHRSRWWDAISIIVFSSLAFGTVGAQAGCRPDTQTVPVEAAYEGYTPTGYKGALQRDRVWHRQVHSRTTPDGETRYRLSHQQTWYESIEPIALGGKAIGYHARRDGCGQLLDPQGKPFPLPAFTRLQTPYETKAGRGVLYQLFDEDAHSERYRYVRFVNGRLFATAAHASRMSYSMSTLEQTFLGDDLAAIVTGPPDRHGLLDMATLTEIVPPAWRGVTGLGLIPYDTVRRFLLVDDGQTRTLLSADGKRELLRGIDKIKLIPDWFPAGPDLPAARRAIIAVTENAGQSCRLFDMDLNLLLPVTLQTRHGECPVQQGGYPDKYFVAESLDQQIYVYTRETSARLQALHRISGRLATATKTGMVLALVDTADGPRYRAFGPDGQPANPQDFDDFRHLGCGFLEVRVGTQWLTLRHDGSTTKERFFPFSC